MTLELHADGSSTIQYVPGVAFDMHGERMEAVCSDSSRNRYDGFAEEYVAEAEITWSISHK